MVPSSCSKSERKIIESFLTIFHVFWLESRTGNVRDLYSICIFDFASTILCANARGGPFYIQNLTLVLGLNLEGAAKHFRFLTAACCWEDSPKPYANRSKTSTTINDR